MSDDFFKKISTIIASQSVQRTQIANQNQDVREFQGDVIGRVSQVAKSYVRNLEEQGIRAEFEQNALGLSFTMRWQDRGHWTLVLGPSDDIKGLQFREYYTGDDGRDIRSADAMIYTKATWKDELLEDHLQKAIENYVLSAGRHGGVR